MANLSVDFKDDILASSNPKRKYQLIHNSDGTVSLEDVTVYQQNGSNFGAKEVNEERTAINKINNDRIVSLDEIDLVNQPGFFVDALAVKELNSTYAITGVDLGGNAGVSLKCFYNTYICEVRIEGKTTEEFPNWGGYRLGILPEKARPKQNIVEYLYESFFLEIGTDGVVNLKVSGQMPSGTSVWGSKMFFIK